VTAEVEKTAPKKRGRPPGEVAFGDHVKICSRCRAVVTASQVAEKLCPAGYLLSIAATRARAKRSAS